MSKERYFQIEDRRTGHVFGVYQGGAGPWAIAEMRDDPAQESALQELRDTALRAAEERIKDQHVNDPFRVMEEMEALKARDADWIDRSLEPFENLAAFDTDALIAGYRSRILLAAARRMADGEFTRDESACEDCFAGEIWMDRTGFMVKCVRPFGARTNEIELTVAVIDQRPTPTEPEALEAAS